jgi:hypothetical protein
MNYTELIERTIKSAAARFRASLERHYPAVGMNGFNERNLTFQFAHEFCRRAGCHAFFEVPVQSRESTRNDNHFDAMLFNSDLLLILESNGYTAGQRTRAFSKTSKGSSARSTSSRSINDSSSHIGPPSMLSD